MNQLVVHKGCLMITGVGLIVLLLVFSLGVWLLGLDDLSALIQIAEPWLLIWRLLVFVILIGGWPHWINHGVQKGWIPIDQRTELIGYRWLLAIWLLLLESLLNQGLLVSIVDALIGLL
ncbi:MAG: hypothetical protein K0U66_00330 [Gammaproteobacteria bacterium]|nr:hypothetical protein [Gammaproteobacteria bacterium]